MQSEKFYLELQTEKNRQLSVPFSKETEGVAHVCFNVDDLKVAKEKYQQLGALFLNERKSSNLSYRKCLIGLNYKLPKEQLLRLEIIKFTKIGGVKIENYPINTNR
ncbi:hypothetical protein [Enterococcus ureasiticus]|uniref:VOC domain-containing protein n=1 Tax=Enterococcus ureasiticus TaxID=903984 RepID=A0A1E5GNF0_9ENTE|nr:hypothetical protein [Enterococcus ureasiticus]OEG14222.1 hypothetical protein BCR21_04330 [Enterococcus ureasiticus]